MAVKKDAEKDLLDVVETEVRTVLKGTLEPKERIAAISLALQVVRYKSGDQSFGSALLGGDDE